MKGRDKQERIPSVMFDERVIEFDEWKQHFLLLRYKFM